MAHLRPLDLRKQRVWNTDSALGSVGRSSPGGVTTLKESRGTAGDPFTRPKFSHRKYKNIMLDLRFVQ